MSGTEVTPKRIQRQRHKGWKKPANTVIVDRTTKWGNPISIAEVAEQYPSLEGRQVATLVVRDFETLARQGSLHLPNWRFLGGARGPVTWTYPSADEICAELAGRNLCCPCPPGRPCHADVLLELANGGA